MKNRIIQSITEFNTRLYFVLVLILFIPTIYKTLRIYYLGDLPSDCGFNVASQITWLNVLFEVIQEALLLPLFFLFGQSISNFKQIDNKIKTGLIIIGFIYLLLAILIFFLAEPLLILMAQKNSIIELSAQYIRLESFAIFLSVIYRFTIILLILLNRVKELFLLLTIQTIATSICDTFLLSHNSFSFQYGVLGIAYGNIIVGLILIFASLFILKRENILIFKKTSLNFCWLQNWFKIGGLSGLESFIRNAIFILIIIRLINMVEGQSYFWTSNSFIWNWLLIPITALGNLIKKDIGERNIELNKVVTFSLIITTLIILIWLISIPLWNSFFKYVMNLENTKVVFEITIISILFYIAYAYNNILDSIFYGYGRTDLMLLQSVITNIFYYGLIFLSMKLISFEVTLSIIVIIFGTGILLDTIVTFWIYKYNLKRNKLIKYFA